MFWLIFGLIIWADVHFFKRVAPGVRDGLIKSMGDGPYRGVVAILLVISIIMMVIGFRQMEPSALYYPPTWLMPIGAAFAFAGIVFLGAANSKSHLRGLVRHNMLTGVVLWGIGHLMISGEWRAINLFGGMILWAVAQMRLINRAEPEYTPYQGGTLQGDIRLAIISIVLTAIIIGIHIWIIRGWS